MYRAFKWAMAYLAPSGIGPHSLSSVNEKEHPRLDSIRVLELRKAITTLRSARGMGKVPVWLQGQGDMAGVTLYTGLFEPDIARFDLHDLPKSHKQSFFLKNALPILDLPQAVALALENSQLILYQDDKKGWDYPAATAKQSSGTTVFKSVRLAQPNKYTLDTTEAFERYDCILPLRGKNEVKDAAIHRI
jgi:hypothetical protein